MSATFTPQFKGRVQIGSESVRFDVTGSLGSVSTKFDAMFTLPAGQALGSETTLWTAEDHGDAETIEEQFKFAILLIDPDGLNETSPVVDVGVGTTKNTAGTNEERVHRHSRNFPWMRGSSRSGATFTDISGTADFTQVTQIRARNLLDDDADIDNDIVVRLLILALP